MGELNNYCPRIGLSKIWAVNIFDRRICLISCFRPLPVHLHLDASKFEILGSLFKYKKTRFFKIINCSEKTIKVSKKEIKSGTKISLYKPRRHALVIHTLLLFSRSIINLQNKWRSCAFCFTLQSIEEVAAIEGDNRARSSWRLQWSYSKPFNFVAFLLEHELVFARAGVFGLSSSKKGEII